MRIISVIVLSFFLWTFGGVFDIAYAIKDSQKSEVSSQQSPVKSGNQVSVLSNQPGSLQAGKLTSPSNFLPTGKAGTSYNSQTQKPEGRFQKAIESLEQILSDTAINTETKKAKIKAKRSEIDKLNVGIREQFTATEKRLKDAGLPGEILQRHYKFVKHYDDNLKELRTNLDAIDQAKTEAEVKVAVGKASVHLETVKPPKRHKALDPNKLPHRVPEIKSFEAIEKQPDTVKEDDISKKPLLIASIGSLDSLLAQASTTTTTTTTVSTAPTDADLAENIEIRFTPEVQAKIAEIGGSPVSLYEYVRNRFIYEPYYGSLKGGQQTLLEKAGNDIDLASALISLLRSANIPARYSCGTIELTTDRLMNWLGGIKDPRTAGQIMATNGIPGKLLTEGGTIKYAQFDHCWVEAYVDMFPSMGAVNRIGKYWTPLDPSIKEMLVREGPNVAKDIPFDEMGYLGSVNNEPPLLSYFNTLNDYYTATHQEDLFTTLYGTGPKWQEFGTLPGTLPYKVISQTRYSEIPDARRHKVGFGLIPGDIYDTGTAYTVEKPFPEIAGKKLTIAYVPATSTDQTIINSYGGLLNTPVYLINVKPEIRLNDATILTGSEIGLGATLTFSTQISSPNLGSDIVDKCISFGIGFAVGIPALNYSAIQLADRTNILSSLQGTLNDSLNAMDSGAGELLNNIAIEYFSQLDIATRATKSLMHIHNTHKPSVAVVSADVEYEILFGMPVSPPKTTGLTIDALRLDLSPISLDGDMNNRKEFIKLRGLNSSYLEHKVVENLLMKGEAVSAVKALQTASQNGIPLYKIDNSNIGSILPLLTVTTLVKDNIRNAVNAGKEVIVSRNNVSINSWTGVGYIVNDPVSGVGEYMISDALNGGHWECPTSGNCNVYLDASIGALAVFVSGEMNTKLLKTKHIKELSDNLRNDVGESIAWLAADFEILTAYILTFLSRFNYTPRISLHASDDEIEMLVNQGNVWIFHYTGHMVEESLYLNNLLDNGSLKSDSKIVFLNSCWSGTGAAIKAFSKGSFMIDQHLLFKNGTGVPRKEIYLGWDGPAPAWPASGTALLIWLRLALGMTAGQAIQNMGPLETTDEFGNVVYVPLVYDGDLTTSLEMWK